MLSQIIVIRILASSMLLVLVISLSCQDDIREVWHFATRPARFVVTQVCSALVLTIVLLASKQNSTSSTANNSGTVQVIVVLATNW